MKIEAGKFYKTRDGLKVRIYATDGVGNFSIHGAIQNPNGWGNTNWMIEGRHQAFGEGRYDIVSEWIDKPEWDWSESPFWVKALAMDESGVWYEYEVSPTKGYAGWMVARGFCRTLHPYHTPSFTGDWKDSLIERPTIK